MSSVHSTISYAMPIGNIFINGESTVYDNESVTSHSKISKDHGRDFTITTPSGYSAECMQKLHSIVPRVSNIMSQLAFTNLRDGALKDLAEGYIKGGHQEAAKFCAQQSQYQQEKTEVKKALDQVSSDAATSSLPNSSYTPKDLTRYRFPKANYLATCLEREPFTSKENHPYVYEKGIIQQVIKTFEDQIKDPQGIEIGVILTLEDFKDKGMRQELAAAISMNVIEGLKACAQEEILETSK